MVLLWKPVCIPFSTHIVLSVVGKIRNEHDVSYQAAFNWKERQLYVLKSYCNEKSDVTRIMGRNKARCAQEGSREEFLF